MKTINTLFLLISMLFSSSSLFAHDFEVDGIYYNITSYADETVEVTYKGYSSDSYYGEYSGSVSIPRIVKRNDTGTMYRVTSIGERAFYGCSGLTSVVIGNSVTSIGDCAFNGCSGLTSVVIGNSVTSIGDYAFCCCYKLTSIEIPNSVTSIGERAFFDCSGLTSVVIGNSVKSIGNQAFSDCSGLTSIEIPNSVTSIGGNAFSDCSGLTSVVIPNSVESIGAYAFSDCSGLTSIVIPNSVTSIGAYAFYGCSGLTSMVVDEDNSYYDSRNNCNAIVESSSNTLICGCKTTIIPNSVTSIGERAFYGCSGLTSVVIGNSVTSIGERAFYGCSGLTSVVICNSVKSIGYQAFSDCSGLTSLTIGSGVESIGGKAFANCDNLDKLYAMSSKAVKCNQNIFSTTVYENAALYVPEGSISSYENTSPWWFFYNISPIPTAIEGVEMDAEDRNAPVYNLQGMKMQDAENLPKGIYVKNGKKFVVK